MYQLNLVLITAREDSMKKTFGIAVAGMMLMGCTSQPAKKPYLKTEMQTPVSGPTQVIVQANNYLKEENTRHVILYSLAPLPGRNYRDELDREFVAAKLFINYIPARGANSVEISGSVDYYERQRYNGAVLVGDIAKSFPVPETILTLTPGKPTTMELPRGIKYSVELSN